VLWLTDLWAGQDVYVIGGGPSLSSFDWDLVREKNTIGCNSAYALGSHVVDALIFGDYEWWDRIGRKGTEAYGGPVFGCHQKLKAETASWLIKLQRRGRPNGCAGPDEEGLCWNGNTGSLAINLALKRGARRVFLLGFDMQVGEPGSDRAGKPNFHDLRYTEGGQEVYSRFKNTFARNFLPEWKKRYPDTEIFNVTDCSTMDTFPRVSLAEHFKIKEAPCKN
jgi:hypothetical protein